MMAFVEAIAGIMFLTTPWVSDHVTPSILNSAARFEATWKSHPMCSGSSVSSFLSGTALSARELSYVLGALTSMYAWPFKY